MSVFDVLRGEQRLPRRSVWHTADLCVSTQEGGKLYVSKEEGSKVLKGSVQTQR